MVFTDLTHQNRFCHFDILTQLIVSLQRVPIMGHIF